MQGAWAQPELVSFHSLPCKLLKAVDIGRKLWVPRNARGHSYEICPPLSFRRLLSFRTAHIAHSPTEALPAAAVLHSCSPTPQLVLGDPTHNLVAVCVWREQVEWGRWWPFRVVTLS